MPALRASSDADLQDLSKLSDSALDAQIAALIAEKQERQSTLIIGAAGAIGQRLCAALAARGHRVIAADRMAALPESVASSIGSRGTCVGSVDVRDAEALRVLFKNHADENTTVWNLAAPLSVDAALDPKVSEAVTIGGMKLVLQAMGDVGASKICFTDSIGSYGTSAPRRGATARWLTENPTQDPGSDYGLQKRAVREMLSEFAHEHGGDPRWAVLPGVLHTNAVWGNGTTEYALDALLAAPHQASRLGLPTSSAYICPVDPDVCLPMVFVDDLMRGLIALQDADADQLIEPERGYTLPGLSFTPNELFAEIRRHYPGFGYRVEINEHMNLFANTWVDELSTMEPMRDLGYAPEVKLDAMVATVLAAHDDRNVDAARAFKAMDSDGSRSITQRELELYVREHAVRGRMTKVYNADAHSALTATSDVADQLMSELDTNKDGIISWATFSEWNRVNNLDKVLNDSLQ